MNIKEINQMLRDMYQEFKINDDGSLTCSLRAASRLVNVAPSSLSRALNSGVAPAQGKLSKFLTQQGFEGGAQVSWIENGIPDMALASIMEYFAYECQERYRSEQAKLFCRAYRTVGLRTHVKEQIGDKLLVQKFNIPTTIQGALRYAADQIDKNEKLEAEKAELKFENTELQTNLLLSEQTIQEQKEDIQTYKIILDKSAHLTGKQLADSLEIPNFGRNQLYKFLRKIHVLCDASTSPRFDKISKGYCGVETRSYSNTNNQTQISQKPIFYFEGVKYIIKKLHQYNVAIPNHVTAEYVWEQNNLIDEEDVA